MDEQREFDFDGATYDRAEDGKRLSSQLQRVRILMADRAWRTLEEIATAIQRGGERDSEAGVSARLRDLRKKKFGELVVEGRRRGTKPGRRGLWEYRVSKPSELAM